MTSTNDTGDNGISLPDDWEQVHEQLTDALNADELDEKNYHIREALQLLNIDED